MSGEAWFTLVVVVATVAAMVRDLLPPWAAMLGAVTVLLVTDVITAGQALSGFSNEAPFIIAALYVLAGAARTTGATSVLLSWLGRNRGERRNLARLLPVTAVMSGVIANTTVVAALAPTTAEWARTHRLAASRYLMPLSFAALVGGLLTTIGTSTNVTVSGLLQQADLEPIGVFEITRIGLPVAVVGVALLILLTPTLLPSRVDPVQRLAAEGHEYTVEMVVTDGPLAGKAVGDANLRNLAGVFLVEIERDERRITPVSPDEILQAGDRLVFAGNAKEVLDLQAQPGLRPAAEPHFSIGTAGPEAFYEVVVGAASPLTGATLKEIGFRGRYGGAVLALHRGGERVRAKLGDVTLRPGDMLLVLADPGADQRWRDTGDFLVIRRIGQRATARTNRAWVVYAAALALIVLAASGLLTLLQAALLAAGAVVATGTLTPAEARRSIDLDVVVLIAASFGLGQAVVVSGLGQTLAEGLVAVFDGVGPSGTLLGVFLATTALTALVSNNAAAVLMFPIGLAAAAEIGADARPFAIAIAVAASTDFLTPVGYQTNTMVLGLGGYRFADFARAGFPLTLATITLSVLLIPVLWPL